MCEPQVKGSGVSYRPGGGDESLHVVNWDHWWRKVTRGVNASFAQVGDYSLHEVIGQNNVEKNVDIKQNVEQNKILIKKCLKKILTKQKTMLKKNKLLNVPRQSQAYNQLIKPYSWVSEREVSLSFKKNLKVLPSG